MASCHEISAEMQVALVHHRLLTRKRKMAVNQMAALTSEIQEMNRLIGKIDGQKNSDC